jgi:hypothetical protein
MRSGLVTDLNHGWLGGSPDDWVIYPEFATDPNGTVEYKCPYTAPENAPQGVLLT